MQSAGRRRHYPPAWPVAVLCLVMFASGWLSVDINIQVKTAMQLYIDPGCLGKVLGISTSISHILIPASLVIAGGTLEVWPSYVLPALSGSVLIVALSILCWLDRKADCRKTQNRERYSA